MDKLFDLLHLEWQVIRGAPRIFLAAVAVIAVLIWFIVDLAYGGRIQGAIEARDNASIEYEAALQTKQATIEHLETLLEKGATEVVEDIIEEGVTIARGAYVFIERGSVFNVTTSGLQGYVLAINNDSEIHAQITDWRVGITVSDTPPPDDLADFGAMPPQEGMAVIRPGGIIPVYRNYDGALSEADIQAIKSGEKRIYVFGEIRYMEPGAAEHATEFCHVYYGMEMSARFDGYEAAQARYCESHNEAK